MNEIIVGSLSGQNWHRQARVLPAERRFDFILEKTLDVARRFGFRPMGFDFGLAAVPSRDRPYLEELGARLRENGIIPNVGIASISLSNDADVRRAGVDELKRSLDLLPLLGATRGTFSCGYNGRVMRQGRVNFAIEGLRAVAPTVESLGLRITQENFDYFTAADLARICHDVGSKNIGIHSDTGNWLILGDDPLAATKTVLPYTLHAHVRDYVYENDTYNGVALGDGVIDFERILPVLADAPVDPIIFSVEVDTDDRDEDDAADRSFAYVKDWIARRRATR